MFSILDSLRLDSERHYWIERIRAEGDVCGIKVDIGQMGTGVEILLTMSDKTLTSTKEYIQ